MKPKDRAREPRPPLLLPNQNPIPAHPAPLQGIVAPLADGLAGPAGRVLRRAAEVQVAGGDARRRADRDRIPGAAVRNDLPGAVGVERGEEIGATDERTGCHARAHGLADAGEIGLDVADGRPAARMLPETGHHFVEHEDGAGIVRVVAIAGDQVVADDEAVHIPRIQYAATNRRPRPRSVVVDDDIVLEYVVGAVNLENLS